LFHYSLPLDTPSLLNFSFLLVLIPNMKLTALAAPPSCRRRSHTSACAPASDRRRARRPPAEERAKQARAAGVGGVVGV
jgi:hypothetical protein